MQLFSLVTEQISCFFFKITQKINLWADHDPNRSKKNMLCGSKFFLDRSEKNVGSILILGISEAIWWIAYWIELPKFFLIESFIFWPWTWKRTFCNCGERLQDCPNWQERLKEISIECVKNCTQKWQNSRPNSRYIY